MIVEKVDRAGHVIELFQFKQQRISIGRGYTNDVVFHDPHVEAEHVVIKFDVLQSCFYVQDLRSRNGTQILRLDKSTEEVTTERNVKVNVGDIIIVGKTRFRLAHPFAVVPAAVPISRFEDVYKIIGNWVFFIAAIVVLILLYTYDQYLTKPYSDNYSKDVITGFFISGIAVGYALVWVLVGKVQHQDGRFFLHANLALLLIIVDTNFDNMEPIFLYNVQWLLLGGYLGTLLEIVLLFWVVAISAAQFNRILPWVRYTIASILPLVAILMMLSEVLDKPEFQPAPSYSAKIVSPVFQWKAAVEEEQFLREVNEVFEN